MRWKLRSSWYRVRATSARSRGVGQPNGSDRSRKEMPDAWRFCERWRTRHLSCVGRIRETIEASQRAYEIDRLNQTCRNLRVERHCLWRSLCRGRRTLEGPAVTLARQSICGIDLVYGLHSILTIRQPSTFCWRLNFGAVSVREFECSIPPLRLGRAGSICPSPVAVRSMWRASGLKRRFRRFRPASNRCQSGLLR